MAKPEWGTKRKCVECGAFFYDMRKENFTCPKCGCAYNGNEFAEVHAKAILKNAKKTATMPYSERSYKEEHQHGKLRIL